MKTRSLEFRPPRSLLQCCPRGETMSKLGVVVQKLKAERERAQWQVDRLNAALAALDSWKAAHRKK
jgi:hypothetical protein